MKLFFHITLYCLIALTTASAQTGDKKPLDYTIYESWKSLSDAQISNNGNWITFEINPAKGDGWFYIVNPETGFRDSVHRGSDAELSPNSNFTVFKIKPQEDSVRALKLAEKKDDDLPKDTLAVYLFGDNSIVKFPRVKSFKTAEEYSDWIVYHKEKAEEVKDTTEAADTTESKKDKKEKKEQDGTELVVYNPLTGSEHVFDNVSEYEMSRNGRLIAFISTVKDSVDTSSVYLFNTEVKEATMIAEMEGIAKTIALDEEGTQAGFLFSGDTGKTKVYSLYYSDKSGGAELIVDETTTGMPEGWSVSENAKLEFSKDGTRLFLETAERPEPEPEDTLLDEEKYSVDVWSWHDPRLMPQQLENLKDDLKKDYLAVYMPEEKHFVQLADEDIPRVVTRLDGNADFAVGITQVPYMKLMSWDTWYNDGYAINVETGERKLAAEKVMYGLNISAGGNYIYWYNFQDSLWYTHNNNTGKTVAVTEAIETPLYDELNDVPQYPRPHGVSGWTDNDEYIIIEDRYDLWKVDPDGEEKPVNATGGMGRENSIRFRYMDLDKEDKFIDPVKPLLLMGFNEETKEDGWYNLTLGTQEPVLLDKAAKNWFGVEKAKNSDRLIWRQGDFSNYYELYTSNRMFENQELLSVTNPQQDEYLWGTVELINWEAYDGRDLDGMLYKPENFDPDKKYPVIVYFYERASDRIHSYWAPSPSRSIVNPAYLTSNDYIVFIPDIYYDLGHPGKSAYNCIVSGTEYIIDTYDFIDKDNIGIQGQSWGGYQVAYLVTQTDMYKAAMAGAPVSNMTSAYGGIRWGSGLSRMFQYEKTQSRIGGTIWNSLDLYIENSPVFFADDVNTPLLMMHNDNDGAVPWYQGIEYFVALRRLNKPVWMLVYNDEAHNLRKWPNRMDLDRRMYQFFDHYLKNEPMPVWMKEGIPAVDKGKTDGYELVK